MSEQENQKMSVNWLSFTPGQDVPSFRPKTVKDKATPGTSGMKKPYSKAVGKRVKVVKAAIASGVGHPSSKVRLQALPTLSKALALDELDLTIGSGAGPLLPALSTPAEKQGYCWRLLETEIEHNSIVAQVRELSPELLERSNFRKNLALKLMQDIWRSSRPLEVFGPPYCHGFTPKFDPTVYDAVTNCNQSLWIFGPPKVGKTEWVRVAFPVDKGYLYITRVKDLELFDESKHRGIVADNLELDQQKWPLAFLRSFVSVETPQVMFIGKKLFRLRYGVQRIVTSNHSPAEIPKIYRLAAVTHGLGLKERWEEFDWVTRRVVPIEVIAPLFAGKKTRALNPPAIPFVAPAPPQDGGLGEGAPKRRRKIKQRN